MEIITGTISDIRGPFKNRWAILILQGGLTVTGELPINIRIGDSCEFEGAWGNHQTYGKQFQAKRITTVTPNDEAGKERFLQRVLSGVGPRIAKDLISHFGSLDHVIHAIENEPAKLVDVKGLSVLKVEKIQEDWKTAKQHRVFDEFCSKANISPKLQEKLIQAYETPRNAMMQIEANPYTLSDDVWGMGFLKTDRVAAFMGVPRTSGKRIYRGVFYALEEAGKEGHCYLKEEELIKKASELLQINHTLIVEKINDLVSHNRIICEDGERFYTPAMLTAEDYVAGKLKRLVDSSNLSGVLDVSEAAYEGLGDDQRRAMDLAMKEKVMVVTGGPGVGKTYTINRILQSLSLHYRSHEIEMAAPTGKAAKRMQETTGKAAVTLHRLLSFSPMFASFTVNEGNPLTCKVLIVDECSMIDVFLMEALLRAIPDKGCRLILVGDKDQLPSVGPGKVFGDIIESGIIPTIELKKLYRQAEASLIHINAQRINKGEQIDVKNSDMNSDFWVVWEEQTEQIPKIITNICKSIPKNFPIKTEGIQILCPQKVGPIGTRELNTMLRDAIFNPDGEKIPGSSFRIGDRVIQMRNNYDLEVFNGDIGTIMDASKESLVIDFDGATVSYPIKTIDDLEMAYALTIHKSQGSEFPCVIIPVHTTNFIMLKRNLIYTGITRGRQMVILVGTQKAINIATRTIDTKNRNTALKEKLRSSGSASGRGIPALPKGEQEEIHFGMPAA